MSVLALSAAAAASAIHYSDLHLSPEVPYLHIGAFHLRWYSLGYIGGILLGWWYLLKLIDQPGAPMARRHADDFVFYATLGIILGGRIAYVLFYDPVRFLHDPIEIVRLWDGGMSFHGGALGVVVGIILLARRNGLSALRIHDYVGCCAPFGLFLVRIANFVNGELWGRETSLPWGVVFPHTVAAGIPEPARHPSQLYEAGIEGLLMFAILSFLFWRTRARYQPGLLLGTFLIVYGIGRFLVEYVREPDIQLGILPWGLSMGQTLSAPMIFVGLYFVLTARSRRVRVEPIAGSASVA